MQPSEFQRHLQAAGRAKCHMMHIVAPYLHRGSLLQTARALAACEFGGGGQQGQVQRCTLSAVTARGVCTQYSRLQALCPRIYLVCDGYGAAAALMMQRLLSLARQAGEQVLFSPCALLPDEAPEHLLLPEKGVAFTVSNTYHAADFPVYCRIHTLLHTDTDGLKAHGQALSHARVQLRQAVQRAILAAR